MKICKSYKDRLLGLMFQKEIKEDYLFPNCRSVHTFFMKFPIDIIAINKEGKILTIYRNVPANKIIIAPKKTYSIIETKAYCPYQENQIIDYKRIESNF